MLGAVILLLAVGYYYGIHASKVLELESETTGVNKT